MKYQLVLDTIYITTILFNCILNASHKYLIILISTIKQHPPSKEGGGDYQPLF